MVPAANVPRIGADEPDDRGALPTPAEALHDGLPPHEVTRVIRAPMAVHVPPRPSWRAALARLALLASVAACALSAPGCAVLMLGSGGHEDGTGSLSDAADRAHADSTSRWKTPPPDVGWTTPPAGHEEPIP